jgi:hypothetical protein
MKKMQMTQSRKAMQVLLLIAVILGTFLLGKHYGETRVLASYDSNDTYEKGWDAAVKRVEDAGVIKTDKAISSIGGTVLQKKGQALTILSDFKVQNPLKEEAPKQRSIIVTSATEITKRVAVDPEQHKKNLEKYKADREAFEQAWKEGNRDAKPPQIPSSYELQKITIDDIAANDYLVISVTGEDLTYADEIRPETIKVMTNRAR